MVYYTNKKEVTHSYLKMSATGTLH